MRYYDTRFFGAEMRALAWAAQQGALSMLNLEKVLRRVFPRRSKGYRRHVWRKKARTRR